MHTSSILPMEARGTSGSSNERVLNKPSFIIIRNKILLQPASRCLKCFLKKHPSRVTYRRSPDIFRANFFFPPALGKGYTDREADRQTNQILCSEIRSLTEGGFLAGAASKSIDIISSTYLKPDDIT